MHHMVHMSCKAPHVPNLRRITRNQELQLFSGQKVVFTVKGTDLPIYEWIATYIHDEKMRRRITANATKHTSQLAKVSQNYLSASANFMIFILTSLRHNDTVARHKHAHAFDF